VDVNKAVNNYQVFISYARDDDEPFANQLCSDISQAGGTVWWDRKCMESRGRTFLQELRDAIENVDRVVFVVGPRSVESPYCRAELEHAVLFAKSVVPILRLGDYSLLPEELALFHCIDMRATRAKSEALADLLAVLSSPVAPLGPLCNLVPSLPPHFLPPRAALHRLSEAVLADVHRPTVTTSASQVVGLQGMGGIGKSVVAAAFARSTETRRAFPDGIVWVSVGQHPDALGLMQQVGRSLKDEIKNYESLLSARQALPRLLEREICLIVMDDVWDVKIVAPFRSALGPRARLLLTTRDLGLVKSLGAQEIQLHTFAQDDALALLAGWSDESVEALPTVATLVPAECGYLPLALSMVGASVRGRPDRWQRALQRLQIADLSRLRNDFPDYPYPNIVKSIEASLDSLESDVENTDPVKQLAKTNYFDFAVFPDNTPIPETALGVLWSVCGMNEADTQDVVDLLVDRALVRRDVNGCLLLHDLHADYVRNIAQRHSDLPALHQRLLKGYWDRCHGEWTKASDDGYLFRNLPYHAANSGDSDALWVLLFDAQWIRASLEHEGSLGLARAYRRLARGAAGYSISDAVAASAPVLVSDVGGFWVQLESRLRHISEPSVNRVVEIARSKGPKPSLVPRTRSYSAPDPALLRIVEGDFESVTALHLSADMQLAVTGTSDGKLELWDLSAEKKLWTIKGHSDRVRALAFRDGAGEVTSISDDATVKRWDLETRRCLSTQFPKDYIVREAAEVHVAGDAACAVYGSVINGLRVWRGEREDLKQVIETHEREKLGMFLGFSMTAALTTDGKYLVAASTTELKFVDDEWANFQVFDLDSGTRKTCIVKEHFSHPFGRFRRPFGDKLAVSANAQWAVCNGNYEGNGLEVWDTKHGVRLASVYGHEGQTSCIAVNGRGTAAASVGTDGTLRLWNLEKAIALNSAHNASVRAVGGWMELGSASSLALNGSTSEWDLTRGIRSHSGQLDVERIFSAALTRDGRFAALCTREKKTSFWDLKQSRSVATVQDTHVVEYVAMSVDGRYVVSASGDYAGKQLEDYSVGATALRVWDVGKNKVVATFPHDREVNEVVMSADGRFVASVSGLYERKLLLSGGYRLSASDVAIKLWDVSRQSCVAMLRADNVVYAIAVTSDGRNVISGSERGDVDVWDTAKNEKMSTIAKHQSAVLAVALIDENRVASGSRDGQIKISDIALKVELASFSGNGPVTALRWCGGPVVMAGHDSGTVHILEIRE
jgi:WD40 repeat protein